MTTAQLLHHSTWLLTVASIVGTQANIYRRRWGFAVWFVANLAWAAYNLWLGAWAQAALWVVYSAFAVQGWVTWGRIARGGGRP